jgi:protein-S-isoprenylcysteine O-methyltransferase Ste14
MMGRAALLLYRCFGYLTFVASFTALMFAATGLGIVLPLDRPKTLPLTTALAIDVGLVLLFGVQHTVMARPSFKRAIARVLPKSAERTTFVVASSVCVGAIAFAWSPIEGDVWRLAGPAAIVVSGIAFAGFGLAGASTFAFDHLALFGLRDARDAAFAVPLLYRIVRHPMMLGMLIGFWAAPHMTVGHAVFAAVLTAYILVGVGYEERDLLRTLGEDYARYQATVPSLLPWPRPRA